MSPTPNVAGEEPESARADGRAPRSRHSEDEADDRTVGSLLAYQALIEIRALAGRARRQDPERTDEALQRIRYLADLTHNVPLAKRPQSRWWPSRAGRTDRRAQAIRARPMTWTWHTAGEQGQAWMLRHIADAGYRWTPPPPLPTPRRNATAWSPRQRLRAVAGWPVRTPRGRPALPRQARVLKALDRDQMYGLYEEADRRRLGLGSAGPVLRAHLDPGAQHYLFADPAEYHWPDEDRPWWQCRVLLQMVDGELLTGILAVLPETFTALPSTVPRMRQRRLALTARMLERDFHLWLRDHEEGCSPQRCGFPPDEE